MSFDIRSSKPIATEFVKEPTLDRALDHAALRIEDGFIVALVDLNTGDCFSASTIWQALADRAQSRGQ